jgi:hypothetical protein
MVGTIIKILDSANAYKDIANIIKKTVFNQILIGNTISVLVWQLRNIMMFNFCKADISYILAFNINIY